MKLKRLVAKAVVAGGLGLPAVGLGIGVANADPPSRPPMPTPPSVPAATLSKPATVMVNGNKVLPTTTARRFASTDTAAPAQTGPATLRWGVNGNRVTPTTRATPFAGPQGRSDADVTALNAHGQAGPAHRLRLFGLF
jgi:hypothetical protein